MYSLGLFLMFCFVGPDGVMMCASTDIEVNSITMDNKQECYQLALDQNEQFKIDDNFFYNPTAETYLVPQARCEKN